MYKFNILVKIKDSKNHLDKTDIKNIDAFKKGIFKPDNIEESDLPDLLKEIGNNKLKNLKVGEKIYKTEITIKTIEVTKE